MTKKVSAAITCLLVLLLASCNDSGWQVFQSDTYTVEFPGIPKDTSTIEANTPGVKVYYQPPENSFDSNFYYSVSQYTMSDSVATMTDYHEQLFRMDAQVFAWGIDGTLADTIGKPVSAGKVKGYEYRVILGGNVGLARIRKFAHGKRIYTVMVLTDNARIANGQSDRFMESFRFTEK